MIIGFCCTQLYLLQKRNKSKRYISKEERKLAEALHQSLIDYSNKGR